jgi:hypothetical protein
VEGLRKGLGILLRAFCEEDEFKVRIELDQHLEKERPETKVGQLFPSGSRACSCPAPVYSNSSRVL